MQMFILSPHFIEHTEELFSEIRVGRAAGRLNRSTRGEFHQFRSFFWSLFRILDTMLRQNGSLHFQAHPRSTPPEFGGVVRRFQRRASPEIFVWQGAYAPLSAAPSAPQTPSWNPPQSGLVHVQLSGLCANCVKLTEAESS